MIRGIILLILLVGFHAYFFYSLWLLLKKGADKLDWFQGFHFANSTNIIFHFWDKYIVALVNNLLN